MSSNKKSPVKETFSMTVNKKFWRKHANDLKTLQGKIAKKKWNADDEVEDMINRVTTEYFKPDNWCMSAEDFEQTVGGSLEYAPKGVKGQVRKLSAFPKTLGAIADHKTLSFMQDGVAHIGSVNGMSRFHSNHPLFKANNSCFNTTLVLNVTNKTPNTTASGNPKRCSQDVDKNSRVTRITIYGDKFALAKDGLLSSITDVFCMMIVVMGITVVRIRRSKLLLFLIHIVLLKV